MIIPTKGIAPNRALLSVGAQILSVLNRPATVSETWQNLLTWRASNGLKSPIPFWWYVLSLDVLFALGVIDLDRGLIKRRSLDAQATDR